LSLVLVRRDDEEVQVVDDILEFLWKVVSGWGRKFKEAMIPSHSANVGVCWTAGAVMIMDALACDVCVWSL
jgi:hypothetical protein